MCMSKENILYMNPLGFKGATLIITCFFSGTKYHIPIYQPYHLSKYIRNILDFNIN